MYIFKLSRAIVFHLYVLGHAHKSRLCISNNWAKLWGKAMAVRPKDDLMIYIVINLCICERNRAKTKLSILKLNVSDHEINKTRLAMLLRMKCTLISKQQLKRKHACPVPALCNTGYRVYNTEFSEYNDRQKHVWGHRSCISVNEMLFSSGHWRVKWSNAKNTHEQVWSRLMRGRKFPMDQLLTKKNGQTSYSMSFKPNIVWFWLDPWSTMH